MLSEIRAYFNGIVTELGDDEFKMDVYCNNDADRDPSGVKAHIYVSPAHRPAFHMLQTGDAVSIDGLLRQVISDTLVIDEVSINRAVNVNSTRAYMEIWCNMSHVIQDANDETRVFVKLPEIFDGIMIPETLQLAVRSHPGDAIQTDNDDTTRLSPENLYEALKMFGEDRFYLAGDIIEYKGLLTCELFGLRSDNQDEFNDYLDFTFGPVENHVRACFEVFQKNTGVWHHSSMPKMDYDSDLAQAILNAATASHQVPDDLSLTTQRKFNDDWSYAPGAVSQITVLDKSALDALKNTQTDFGSRWEFWNEAHLDDIRLVCWVINGRCKSIPRI